MIQLKTPKSVPSFFAFLFPLLVSVFGSLNDGCLGLSYVKVGKNKMSLKEIEDKPR